MRPLFMLTLMDGTVTLSKAPGGQNPQLQR